MTRASKAAFFYVCDNARSENYDDNNRCKSGKCPIK